LSARENFHFLALAIAKLSKYRLGPALSKAALMTLPELSTVTRTATLMRPRIE